MDIAFDVIKNKAHLVYISVNHSSLSQHQWGTNGGKCGVCGDPYDGKRENEAGGKYATGTIVATYNAGDVIAVTVEITGRYKMQYFINR